MNKKMQSVLVLLALVLAGFSASLHAEDTDIYVDNSATSGAPNVLFILDNGANFDATSSGPGCQYYAGTSEAPSLGTTTAAGVVQCALVDAINSLPDGALNIGLLVTNGNGYGRNSTSPSDKAYHELCNASGAGGCLLRKLALMKASDGSKASMMNFIKSWNKTGNSNDANNFSVKVQTATQDTAMQEAWAYYNGAVGFSGTNYGTSIIQSGCQRNFIIYIANTDKTPANGNPSPGGQRDSSGNVIPGSSDYSLSDTRVVPNPDTYGWAKKITDPVTFTPPVCGTTTIAAGSNSNDWSTNWADEWARLGFEQDRGTKTQSGNQNIRTYTIGLTTDKCFPDTPALLSSMASHGGGKYFQASNASQVKEALATVLNEVQAVNSVFSSASLPVSVNAQGTYLNQIFLGMFRPDSSAAPRWMGNLKQYKLVTQGGNLVMGDANGNSAINNNTGFLSPTALSFWTYKDVSAYPDKDLVTADSYGTIGGFFRADKTDKLQGKGTPPTTYDAPDGEVVEKGGVAQQIRKENLTATFAGDRSASNPRRLYTYCPSGSSTCVADLTDPMHSFVTTNTGIGATSFGSSTSVPISSIVRTGTTALVTTRGNHGFSTGAVVTVINATQPEYNVTQAITVNSPTTFTITGLPDSPTTPATGTYTISLPGSTPIAVQTLTRTVNSAGTSGREVATATTAAAHGYSVGSKVMVSGVAGAGAGFYMTAATVTGVPSTTSFTYEMDVDPHAGLALNTYQVNLNRAANPSYSSVTLTNGTTAGLASGTIIGNNFHVGQKIIVSGAPNNQNGFNATFTVKSVSGANFVLDNGANGFKTNNGTTSATVTLTPDYTAYSVTLTRGTGSASAGATVTGAATSAPSDFFGPGKKVDIQKVSGSASNETAYSSNPTPVISCSSPCTTFTFSVPVIPVEAATGSMTVALQGPTATVSPPNLTRGGTDGTTGSVTGLTAGTFTNGQVVNIAASGTQLSSEQAYAGQWTITCPTTSCTSFTFGPINVSPASPATGSNMQAYSGSSGPDRTSLIRWIRGENNQADENNPYPTVTPAITVRESVHGDVLHSRPLVINYGDARGIVAYYGANDGIFRAVNGNITGSIGSSPAVPPGGEIWGLLLPEHYLYYDRLRQNTPELKFPSTFSTTARYKDYFIDGPTGSYQKLNADGTINTAHIFLTMRRGGRFMYALDVTQPAQPKFLWKKSNTDPGFEELGQTWSRPRLTLLQGYANPVLIFGAGYDPAEDSEPPGTDTMGRGIYVVDAATGDLLWSAVNTCSGNTVSTTSGIAPVCVSTASKGMVYAIPSDIAFVDRSGPDGKPDGKIDKLYVGDVGGNVWRVDVADSDMTKWAVTKLAALGCDSGVCAAGTAPRKFFFPPSVLSIKGAGATGSYDAISIVSGDREHPLKNTAANSAYNTVDRFFMLKDTATTLGTAPTASANGVPFLMSSLFKITTAAPTYDNSGNGFYYTFATGEKAVNAPLAVSGFIFFSTNKPKEPDGTCVPDLGTATAYAINPFSGAAVNNVLEGGGLPPSAVSGIVEYTTTTTSGGTTTSTTTQEKFCIGCGISGSQLGGTNTTQCSSALENCNVGKSVAKNLRRTYWYKK